MFSLDFTQTSAPPNPVVAHSPSAKDTAALRDERQREPHLIDYPRTGVKQVKARDGSRDEL